MLKFLVWLRMRKPAERPAPKLTRKAADQQLCASIERFQQTVTSFNGRTRGNRKQSPT